MHVFVMAGVQHWWRGGADFVLHPLIHTFPLESPAQDVEEKKA